MNSLLHNRLILLLVSELILLPPTLANDPPIHTLGSETCCVQQWLVIGPFPNTAGSSDSCEGTMAAVRPRQPLGRIVCAQNGIVDLNRHFKAPQSGVAYAFARVVSPSEQTVQCFLGSGDNLKVWLNGRLVFERFAGGFEESCVPGKHQFSLALRAGENALLLKVESRIGDWAFIAEIADASAAGRIVAE